MTREWLTAVAQSLERIATALKEKAMAVEIQETGVRRAALKLRAIKGHYMGPLPETGGSTTS
jgi:hypothetical protein